VHDELLLEVPEPEVDHLVPVLRETMERALPLDVPLLVDVKVGGNWESMTEVPRPGPGRSEPGAGPGMVRRTGSEAAT
jgi:hypothetical protein